MNKKVIEAAYSIFEMDCWLDSYHIIMNDRCLSVSDNSNPYFYIHLNVELFKNSDEDLIVRMGNESLTFPSVGWIIDHDEISAKRFVDAIKRLIAAKEK